MSQPLAPSKTEETLKSRPDMLRLKRTQDLIESQIRSRRERHLYQMDNFEALDEEYQKDELEIFNTI